MNPLATRAPIPQLIRFEGKGVFNPDTLALVHDQLDRALVNQDIEVVYLRGEQGNFSQGLDLSYLKSHPVNALTLPTEVMSLVARLLTFPLPVVSLVTGHAFGFGAMLVLASDYAVMRTDRGFFCLPEVDIGMNLTVRMNALVKSCMTRRAVRDTLYTGARLTAERALALEIVDAIGVESELPMLAEKVVQPMLGKPRKLLSGLKYGQNKALVDLINSSAGDHPIVSPLTNY